MHLQWWLIKKNFAFFKESPENMLRETGSGYEYSNIEKQRELLSEVTDEQKLDILTQTKGELGRKLMR